MMLNLPYPVSANRYWRTFRNRQVRSDEANMYRDAVAMIALAHFVRITESPVTVNILLRPKITKRGFASGTVIDLDNCLKVVLDCLQGIAYHNDKQVKRLVVEYGAPCEGGGLDVSVSEYQA